MKHRGEKWTIDEINLAKSLYSSGLKINEIALKVNHSYNAIEHKLKEFGLTNRRVLWTSEEDEKLKNFFYQGLEYSKIAEILGKTIRACQGRAIRNGLKKKECNVWKTNKPRSDFWTDNQIYKMKELIESGASRKEIAHAIGRSESSINNKMFQLSLYLKSQTDENKSKNRRVYYVDDNYFNKIDSQKKSYFLGWLLTDGNVKWESNTKRGKEITNQIELSLVYYDIDVLEEFKKELKSDAPIKIRSARTFCYNGKKIKSKERCCFRFSSSKMVKDLMSYGIKKNKTYSVCYPELLNEKYAPGFIAGAISGDGCVDVKKNHEKGRILRCSLAGNYELLLPIKNILVKYIGYNPNKKILRNRNCKQLYILEFSQTETLNLYYWMKDNGITLMKRKNDIIEKFIKDKCKILTEKA